MDADRLGGDILAERRLTSDELVAALSSLLSIPPEKIVTYNDWEELPEDTDQTNLYCRFWHPQGGEFHTVIDLPCSLLQNLPRDPTASRFAELLGCRILVDDGSVNPFAYILHHPNGEFELVHLAVESAYRDEIVINRG